MNTYNQPEDFRIYMRDYSSLKFCVACGQKLHINRWAHTDCWREMSQKRKDFLSRLHPETDRCGTYIRIPSTWKEEWRANERLHARHTED